MSIAMIETARYLVQEMIALVGYTQSDEITLAWYESSQSESGYAFDGRFQKLASVLAGMASARFCQLVATHLPSKVGATPHFDCRVWQVPTLQDAIDVFVWREDDATKNSVTMAAGAYYTDAELDRKNSSDKQEMLFQQGVNWNDYPRFFKRGTYLQRRSVEPLIAIARAVGARAVSYAFVIEVDEAVRRNAARTGRACIDVVGIYAVAKKLVLPGESEGFDERYEVRSGESGFAVTVSVLPG